MKAAPRKGNGIELSQTSAEGAQDNSQGGSKASERSPWSSSSFGEALKGREQLLSPLQGLPSLASYQGLRAARSAPGYCLSPLRGYQIEGNLNSMTLPLTV